MEMFVYSKNSKLLHFNYICRSYYLNGLTNKDVIKINN